MIRLKCMKYIQAEKDYFQNYIEGGLGGINSYVERKSNDGEWGDDIELQAIREIYNRPIEIYAYSNKPMKTFHESKRDES